MKEQIINSFDANNQIDHINKNENNLKKAIRTMPITILSKRDLDKKITNSIKSLDDNIHEKVNQKIKNNKLTKHQELELDGIVFDLANKSNDLVLNMISSLDDNFPNQDFKNLEKVGNEKLSNVLDGIEFLDNKKINELSETEKILTNNDTGGFANAYKNNGGVGGMFMSAFK